jgi:hypothetical protein
MPKEFTITEPPFSGICPYRKGIPSLHNFYIGKHTCADRNREGDTDTGTQLYCREDKCKMLSLARALYFAALVVTGQQPEEKPHD